MADSGKLVKMEVDYSDTVDKSLPEFQEMAKVSVKVPNNEHFILIKAHFVRNTIFCWNSSCSGLISCPEPSMIP